MNYPMNRINKNAAGSLMIWLFAFFILVIVAFVAVYKYEKKKQPS
jgi:hypothetical protein